MILLKERAFFLLGPRQTGKSTLLKTVFPNCHNIDLLEADTFRELSAFPESMRQRLTPADRLIIIDEIQKLPSLLVRCSY
jgi:predicted AAA+ superfamily ATPase